MSELPGVTSGNTREHKVKRFLAKPPQRTMRLLLVTKPSDGEEALQLGEWQRDEIVPMLAPVIVQAMDDHADSAACAVTALLVYVDAEGRTITTMLLRREAAPIQNAQELTEAVLSGDAKSTVVLANAQSLAVQRVYLSAVQSVISAAERISDRAEDRNEALLRRVVELENENASLKTALVELEAMVAAQATGAAAPPSPGQERALALLEQMAPVLLTKLLSAPPGGATPQA